MAHLVSRQLLSHLNSHGLGGLQRHLTLKTKFQGLPKKLFNGELEDTGGRRIRIL